MGRFTDHRPRRLVQSRSEPNGQYFHRRNRDARGSHDAFAAKVADTRGHTIIERWGVLHELGNLFEWQTLGWFKFLGRTRLKDVKVD